jgi:branched-chain amino acid transport system substrate-binding protein
MIGRSRYTLGSVALALALAFTGAIAGPAAAADQPPLKIGVVMSYTGPDALGGKEFDDTVALFMKQHGDTIAGRKVELIKRDTGGPSPDVAKRLATELVTRDAVDMIIGIDYTPTAVGVGTVSTQAKKPVFIMNAATAGILRNAPYMVRFGYVTSQNEAPLGAWAARNKIRSVYMIYADYAPGLDASAAFAKAFTAGGGKIAGDVKVPITNSDFSSYVQRIKDAKPDGVFVFVPLGPASQQFMKAWADAGMAKSGVKLLGDGSVTDETAIDSLGDAAIGMITTYPYSEAHPTKANADFVNAFRAMNGTSLRPDLFAAFTWDLMTGMYRVIAAQGGKVDPDKTIELVRGMRFNGPRGALQIDAETRDPIQTIYVRRVEKRGGKLWNVEFDSIPMVRPPAAPPEAK